MQAVIDIHDLTVGCDGRSVLSVPRLVLGEHELLALMGPNGAGKSTFLRACLGLQRTVAGRVCVFGRPLDGAGWRCLAALRRSIGYVPQVLSAHSETPLTVREVVAMGVTGVAGLCGRLRVGHRRAVDVWLERLGLTRLAGRRYSDVSGGEQRKVLIARAMVGGPRLLLLDEPTANLDLGWRERIVQTIEMLWRQEGVSMVLACHAMEVIPPSCQRVLLLDRGRVAASGRPEEVWTDARVAALYGPGLKVAHRAGRHAVMPVGCGDA